MTNRVAVVTGAYGGIGRAVCDVLELLLPTRRLGHEFDVTRPPYGLVCDVLICCHAAFSDAKFREVIGVDLIGTYNVCLSVLPHMLEQHYGRIVTFSSIRAHAPRPGQAAYAAAKSGVEGLTRALAVEYGPQGILVNCVAPGAVLTPRTTENIRRGIVSEEELKARTPTGRLTTPEEVARVVAWLVSEECHVNGQVVVVDGGWSISG